MKMPLCGELRRGKPTDRAVGRPSRRRAAGTAAEEPGFAAGEGGLRRHPLALRPFLHSVLYAIAGTCIVWFGIFGWVRSFPLSRRAAAPQAHLGARIAGARQKYLPPYLREPPPAPEPAPAPAPAPRAQVRIMRALQHRVAVLSPLRPVLAGLRRKAGRTLVGLRVPARAAEGWAAARRAASSVGQ